MLVKKFKRESRSPMVILETKRKRRIHWTRTLSPTLHKIRHNLFKTEQMLKLVDKAIPYKVSTIYDGLSHWCSYGQNDMDSKNFISHKNEHHNGIVQKFCQINRIRWLDNSMTMNSKNCFALQAKIYY
jgi:hypothetical protein